MTDAKHQKFLKTSRETPMTFGDFSLTKYQHVERLGNEEVEGILDGEVIVQTKLDGANLTVAWDNGIVIASRNNIISYPGHLYVGTGGQSFRGAIDYVTTHVGFISLAQSDHILRCEYLKKHTVRYAQENYGHVYVYDVQRKDLSYKHPIHWMGMAQALGVRIIPITYTVHRPTVDYLTKLVAGPDEFGAEQKEGLVIKRYDGWTNKFGHITWAKLIAEDFREKNKLVFGGSSKDPPEVQFVANTLTRQFIHKTICTLEDSLGRRLTVRDMPQVLGRCWHDAFSEELWNFIKKGKVKNFDFDRAERLSYDRTRDVALDYFNGIEAVR